MANELNFEAHDEPLRDILFSNSKFRIPRYQRPYAWTEDQVGDFWTDLTETKGPFFLGSFIFNKESLRETGFFDVIDGQQRLLTVTILMAALRDIARNIDLDTARLIQTQDIAIEDRTGNQSYRVICGDSTKDFFATNVQAKDADISKANPITPEEKFVKQNYQFFRGKLESEISRCDSQKAKLEYIRHLRETISELQVIRIEIDSEEDAYEIFETTNARGVDLSIADLLKNLIFKKYPAQEARDVAKEIWAEMVENVQETDTELKKFIRYYWISKHSMVTEKHLFKQIKKQITDWESLLMDLHGASEGYNKLVTPTKEDWKDFKHGNRIYNSLCGIKIMGVSQCYVLFLSILRNYDKLKTDPTRVFEAVERFSFHYSAVCKGQANKVEKIYSTYARRIEDCVQTESEKKIAGKIQSLFDSLTKELKDEMPSYEFFRERFEDVGYGTSPRSRQFVGYILNKIESGNGNEEKAIDFDKVNIEHILPQTPSKDWKLTKKEIKKYVNMLGNLTLVSSKTNSKVGNKGIREKAAELVQSQIRTTKELAEEIRNNEFKWGEEEIRNRQNRLAELAYKRLWVL